MIRCTWRSGTPVTDAASFAVMSVVWFVGTEHSKILPSSWKHISHLCAHFQCAVSLRAVLACQDGSRRRERRGPLA